MMHNSESDKTVYNISNRPYPTVEEYEDELKPFIDAGCEVRFSRPRGSHVSEMRGCHRALDISFEVNISNECRENPQEMRRFLQEVWQDVKQEIERKKVRLAQ